MYNISVFNMHLDGANIFMHFTFKFSARYVLAKLLHTANSKVATLYVV